MSPGYGLGLINVRYENVVAEVISPKPLDGDLWGRLPPLFPYLCPVECFSSVGEGGFWVGGEGTWVYPGGESLTGYGT